MLKRCACQRKGFYQYGAFLALLLVLFSIHLIVQCSYAKPCKMAHYICWAVFFFGTVLSVVMMAVGAALSKVTTLTMQDLNSKMSNNLQRWGWIAKACPVASRYIFNITGVLALLGLAVASSMCPDATAILTSKEYNVTCVGREHNPKNDFGVIFVLWLALAIIGCCSATDKTALPFLFTPIPEIATDTKGKCTVCCERATSCCHPR